MNDNATLNSRLRVLIAKTFRAEKLYGSMKSAPSGIIASSAVLSEMANDIRAREWQRSHTQLRTNLNDILSIGSASTVAQEIARLRDRFRALSEEGNLAIEQTTQSLVDTAKRHEFVHTLKLSFELIRNKAKAQANHVIAEELTSVLQASGRGQLKVKPEDEAATGTQFDESPFEEEQERQVANASATNVIPFKSRFSVGRKR